MSKRSKPQTGQTRTEKSLQRHLRKSGSSADNHLFDRVVSILEQARSNVVRAVNSNMVLAYWMIGREIVEAIQGGKGRAEYGEQILANLSLLLTERYGNGFSVPNLQNFRKFYLAFSGRIRMEENIQYPWGTKFEGKQIQYPMGIESAKTRILHPSGGELARREKSSPPGSETPQGFSSQLSWSHYRALMRVENEEARLFYEREAMAGSWDKRTLERQIHSY